MAVRFKPRTARAPSGVEWRIGRRWLSRGLPRWRKVRVGGGETAEAAWWSMPDGGGPDDFAAGIAILIGALVVAVVLIPLLLFGIELILVGVLIAAGILGRGLLGRPWVVDARCCEDPSRTLAWKVVGWRRSARLIDEVAASLANGRDPAPAEDAERIAWTAGAPDPDLEQKR